LTLIKPLLLDPIPPVQLTAIVAVGRLASHSPSIADSIISEGFLGIIGAHLKADNKHFKKACLFVYRSLAKHGEEQAKSILDNDAISEIVDSLNFLDASVKEAACWAIGCMGKPTAALSNAVIAAGAIPLLVTCYKEPELTLRRVALSALSDLIKYDENQARKLYEAEVIPSIVRDIENPDPGMRRQALSCLYQLAKHSTDLASDITRLDAIPKVILALQDSNEGIRKNACTLLREISKHNDTLATLIVTSGGLAGFAEYLNSKENSTHRLPAIMALGYISTVSETLAMACISSAVIPLIDAAIIGDSDDTVKASCAWTLSQIGKHSPEHARAVIDSLPKIVALFLHLNTSDDTKDRAREAFKAIVSNVTDTSRLEPILRACPPRLLKYVIRQFAKVLPNDAEGRKHFVTSGSLQHIQSIKAETDEKLSSAIQDLKSVFPPEVVSYFSPTYSEEIMRKLDDFVPPQRP